MDRISYNFLHLFPWNINTGRRHWHYRLLEFSVAYLAYAEGYPQDDSVDEYLIEESAALAAKADIAVLFVGQPEFVESEMHDLTGIELPLHQVKLIEAVTAVQHWR
jgi:hypothetical protein